MATPAEQAMIALQQEMQNTRAQLGLLGQRFDELLTDGHGCLSLRLAAFRASSCRTICVRTRPVCIWSTALVTAAASAANIATESSCSARAGLAKSGTAPCARRSKPFQAPNGLKPSRRLRLIQTFIVLAVPLPQRRAGLLLQLLMLLAPTGSTAILAAQAARAHRFDSG